MNTVCHRHVYAAMGFTVAYAMAWTIASFLLDPSVPYDAIEALNWATNAEFGSPKNPYMVGGIMAVGQLLEPAIPITLYWYLSHFVGVAIGMAGVWLLSRRVLGNNELALLSLMSLNLTGVTSFDIIPYNDNYLLVMLWPYVFLFFIKAIYDSAYHWFSLAVVTGLSAMSKYSTFAFLPFMLIYTLAVPEARKAYKSPVFYLAILLFLLLLVPNAVWLHGHDYAACNWVQSQLSSRFTLDTAIAFGAVFYPVLLLPMILTLLGGRWNLPDTAERRAVLFVFVTPLLLILAFFSFHSGGRITEWIQPFAILTPVALLSLLNMGPIKSLRGVSYSLLALSIAVWVGYSTVLKQNIHGAGTKRAYLKSVSVELNTLWREKYHEPLKFVGGGEFSHWLTFYAPDRPRIAVLWSNSRKPNIYSSNINARDILDNGALLVSDPGAVCCQTNFADAISDCPAINTSETQAYSFVTKDGQTLNLTLAFSPPHRSGPQ
jgi:Dolichyl-phosphate-mannose-protein mannosyltransferase